MIVRLPTQPEPVKPAASDVASASVNLPVSARLPLVIGTTTVGEETIRLSTMMAIWFCGARASTAASVAARKAEAASSVRATDTDQPRSACCSWWASARCTSCSSTMTAPRTYFREPFPGPRMTISSSSDETPGQPSELWGDPHPHRASIVTALDRNVRTRLAEPPGAPPRQIPSVRRAGALIRWPQPGHNNGGPWIAGEAVPLVDRVPPARIEPATPRNPVREAISTATLALCTAELPPWHFDPSRRLVRRGAGPLVPLSAARKAA
jgi:hypothetical protein